MAKQLAIGGEFIDSIEFNDEASDIKCKDADGNESNVQAELNKLDGNINEKRKLLWTNSTLNSNFAKQTISIDLSDYDYIEVIFSYSSTETDAIAITKSLIGAWGNLFWQENNRVSRLFSSNDEGVTFEVGKTGSPGAELSNDNSKAIPYKIYGIKE